MSLPTNQSSDCLSGDRGHCTSNERWKIVWNSSETAHSWFGNKYKFYFIFGFKITKQLEPENQFGSLILFQNEKRVASKLKVILLVSYGNSVNLWHINTMSCPIIFNSNTIELIVRTSCYCGLRLTLCYLQFVIL